MTHRDLARLGCMQMSSVNPSQLRAALPWLVFLYTAASFLHFAHNAEYLADYPNLPASFSRLQIYLAWCAIGAIGALGYVLFQYGKQVVGLCVLAAYAAFGFDGLLHYTRAPFASHTIMMNSTICLEAVAAGALLVAALGLLVTSQRSRRMS